jgi:acyl-coenzyme A thioesterase PaaI-like protein
MVATGRVVHQTKRLFLAECVVSVEGKIVARGSGSFMRSATRLDGQIGYIA